MTTDLTNKTFAPLRVLIDEFARGAVQHAVVSPGSRNAPIAHVLGDHEAIKTWSVLDERSAGFFALGIAKSSRSPVIVTCTSGSAAANLHPAVVEASHAGVPLIVLTADRPPELRDVGAGQAIDQIKLYGDAVRWFVEAGNHQLTDETLRHFRALGSRALAEATADNPGPVHVNLPLREPLRPVAEELGDLVSSVGALGRADGSPWTSHKSAPPLQHDLFSALRDASHPLFVVGEQHQPDLALAICHLAAATGAPVFADSLSQLRRKELTEHSPVIAAYDLILRSEVVKSNLKPDLVVRIGATPTSKPLRAWLGELQADQILIDPRGIALDPSRNATQIWKADPLATVTAAAARVEGRTAAISWTGAWEKLETAAQSAIDHALAEESFPFEPAVYRNLVAGLDGGATVFVSSSMPIRDVEAYGPIGRDDVRYLSNRGTNGIDGVLSTALGVSAAYPGCDRVIVLTGDLALLYDASALGLLSRFDLPVTIVCVDNDGGGIFSFLPVAEHDEHFEELIVTPQDVDIEKLAAAYGVAYRAIRDGESIGEAVKAPGIVHLKTDRRTNKAGHDRVAAHVLESVAAALTETGVFH